MAYQLIRQTNSSVNVRRVREVKSTRLNDDRIFIAKIIGYGYGVYDKKTGLVICRGGSVDTAIDMFNEYYAKPYEQHIKTATYNRQIDSFNNIKSAWGF